MHVPIFLNRLFSFHTWNFNSTMMIKVHLHIQIIFLVKSHENTDTIIKGWKYILTDFFLRYFIHSWWSTMTKFSFILPSSRQLLFPLESWRIPFQILHPAFLLLGPKQGRFEPCYSSRSEDEEKNRIDDKTNNQNIIVVNQNK